MIHNLSRLIALILTYSISTVATANESTNADQKPKDRGAVIEELTAKKVNVAALTMKLDGYVPTIGLGNGPNGDPEANANDETLALVVQLPEIERIFINGGKFSADGFAKLALLPRLRSLDIYGSDMMTMCRQTQLFDPAGYWTPERIEVAMKELGKPVPQPKP